FASAGALIKAIASAKAAQLRKIFIGRTPSLPSQSAAMAFVPSGLGKTAREEDSLSLIGQRLGADLGKRRSRRDRFRIDRQADDRWFARGLGIAERFRKVLGPLDRRAETAEGARIAREIGIAYCGRRNAARIFALLVHADSAIHAVVEHDRGERQIVLNRSCEFL